MNRVQRLAKARDGLTDEAYVGPSIFDEAGDAWSEPESGGDLGIDLRAVTSALWRSRWIIVAILVCALLAGVAATLLTAPKYKASASIQIDQGVAKVLGTEQEDQTSASLADADRFLQTQVDVLHSRALAQRVVGELHLATKPGFFDDVGVRSDLSRLSEAQRGDLATDILMKGLDVNLPRNSRVVGVSFTSRNPALSATIANSFTDQYIEGNLQRRFDQSAYARSFLQQQLDLAKARLEQSELATIAYSRNAGLIDASAGAAGNADQTGPRSLTTANLVQLNDAYAAARSARIQAEQHWVEASATPSMSLPEVLSNGAIQELVQKRADLQAAYEQDLKRHKANYPTVQQSAAAIAELDREIDKLASGVRGSIEEAYRTAQRQEAALQANLDVLKGETLSEQDRGVRSNILKREADTNRQLYDALLQRYKQVSAEAGATNNNVSVIDRADPPKIPVSPRPLPNLALAGPLGAALAALTVFARERYDDSIRLPEQVEDKLGLPLLGTVPVAPSGETPLQALAQPRSPLAEAYHSVRTLLELSSSEGAPGILLVTSTQQGEGKSTTAFAIAETFARAGKRILLVDADLRKPSLHRLLSLPNARGLSNLLAGQAEGHELIVERSPNLHVLPCGPLPPNPAELLESVGTEDRLRTLAGQYDHVVLDGPPIMGLADAPRLSAFADGTLFVIEAARGHRGAAKAAVKRLMRVRAHVTGVVLTKFDPKRAGYGEYESYYGYSYGKQQA